MNSLLVRIFGLLLLIQSAWCNNDVSSLDLDILAEFTTVDYLWDSNHTRALYEESGEFVVCNNIITGIKVDSNGDMYVAVPRWMSGVPASLNKLVQNPLGSGYVLSPWPSWEFNQINQTGSLQYAQSFIIDSNNLMWIPEVGRTNFYDANPSLETSGPAGIFVVNITSGEVVLNYYFPENVVSYNSSFVNDIVLDEVNGYAYFSNTWGSGGIIVYNIAEQTSHMFTAASTNRNSSYNFCVNGICYGTDGVGASPSDGIALSSDGATLYWSAVQGQELYSIPASALWDFTMTDDEFQAQVTYLGPKAGCSDGLLYLNGALFYGDITTSQVGWINDISKHTSAGSVKLSSSDQTSVDTYSLNWLDTFSSDLTTDSVFYFTTNRLNLFFSASMDFTGQSGANMRIYKASINYDSDDSDSFMSPGIIVGVVLGVIVFLSLLTFCVYWFSDLRNGKKKTPLADAAAEKL